ASAPTVILIVGVNGAGKTTLIGKLSARFVRGGRRVMVAAGDTFRAGAIDQLRVWAERAGAEFAGARAGTDPAAVAFDAIDAAVAAGREAIGSPVRFLGAGDGAQALVDVDADAVAADRLSGD